MEERPTTPRARQCSGSLLYSISTFLIFDCRLKFLFISVHAADPQGEVTHIFFPLRYIPYKSQRQLYDPSHPDYSAVHQPTEKDKANLERWINYVNGKLGGKYHIEKDKFEFAAMKNPE